MIPGSEAQVAAHATSMMKYDAWKNIRQAICPAVLHRFAKNPWNMNNWPNVTKKTTHPRQNPTASSTGLTLESKWPEPNFQLIASNETRRRET
mmetsp:Transcript_32968/g.74057  ORF Transcript_32968/g.74057 Transcript_32968/m.74057 type:complete len:93 (+) Transcript_32968:143-421(+)